MRVSGAHYKPDHVLLACSYLPSPLIVTPLLLAVDHSLSFEEAHADGLEIICAAIFQQSRGHLSDTALLVSDDGINMEGLLLGEMLLPVRIP